MRGRLTGSPEHRKAAEYVAQQFQKAGLKAAGEDGFLQPVKFHAWKLVEPESSLELIHNGKPERLTLGEDAIIGRGVRRRLPSKLHWCSPDTVSPCRR